MGTAREVKAKRGCCVSNSPFFFYAQSPLTNTDTFVPSFRIPVMVRSGLPTMKST